LNEIADVLKEISMLTRSLMKDKKVKEKEIEKEREWH
jgi:hypothetical protein